MKHSPALSGKAHNAIVLAAQSERWTIRPAFKPALGIPNYRLNGRYRYRRTIENHRQRRNRSDGILNSVNLVQNRAIHQGTLDFIQTFGKKPQYGAVQLVMEASYVTRSPWFVAAGAPKNAHLSMALCQLEIHPALTILSTTRSLSAGIHLRRSLLL
jgi:hypothetical protein